MRAFVLMPRADRFSPLRFAGAHTATPLPIKDTVHSEKLSSDFSLLDAQAIADEFGADFTAGLPSSEVAKRIEHDGPNTLRTEPGQPAWRLFTGQFRNPLVYVLVAASAITIIVWTLEGGHGWPVDALVIGVIVLLNALLGFFQESRSRQAAAALMSLTEASSALLRDGVQQRIPSTGRVRVMCCCC